MQHFNLHTGSRWFFAVSPEDAKVRRQDKYRKQSKKRSMLLHYYHRMHMQKDRILQDTLTQSVFFSSTFFNVSDIHGGTA